MRIGVYICHCGGNISDVVDVKKVAESVKDNEGVTFVRDVEHMCSEEGQKYIIDDIKEHNLDHIVVASCSPLFHEKTFMKTVEKAGLNAYNFEMANIREQCSWCHFSKGAATSKAIDLVNMALAKVRSDIPLERQKLPIGRRVLVIGGGITGIQASLDLGDSGFEVYLVEKEPAIGGKMAKLSKTFPTEDCATCIIGPKLADCAEHPNINLMTYSEIESITGYLGNFTVTVRKKPRYVDIDKCVACGICADKCPVKVPDEFNEGLSLRKAIYVQNPVAVPRKYLIDEKNCKRLVQGGKICGICEKLCTQGAINFEDKEELISFNVDTIITATGYELFDPEKKPVYGFGKYSNVLTALQLERIIATGSSGPPLKPIGKRVAFIQCVGSRDEQVDRENCSRICCMYATKLAQLLKRLDPSRDIYIFYTDLRAYGKGFEEYYKRAQNAGIKYIRGRVAEIREDPQSKKLHILSEDTLSRKMIEGEFDLVVLSTGIVPSSGSEQIADILKLARSADGFLQEAHPKFRPVDTLIDGVFIAGCAQGPKDIPDSVAQGSASASRAMRLMNKGVFEIEPIIAFVHNDICDGCGLCINSCPLKAISIENGKAKINEVICKGCGMCIADCPNDALDLRYYTNKQLMEQIDEALKTKKEGETRIIVFADNTCTYRLADNIGTARLSYPAETRIIRVPSVSRITPKLLLYAFKSGADGIFMGECDNRASPYTGSVDKIKKNVSLVKEILKKEGISEERLKFAELLASLLTDFYKHITELTKFLKKEEPISIEKRERLWEIAKNELFSERVEA